MYRQKPAFFSVKYVFFVSLPRMASFLAKLAKFWQIFAASIGEYSSFLADELSG